MAGSNPVAPTITRWLASGCFFSVGSVAATRRPEQTLEQDAAIPVLGFTALSKETTVVLEHEAGDWTECEFL